MLELKEKTSKLINLVLVDIMLAVNFPGASEVISKSSFGYTIQYDETGNAQGRK